MFGRFSQLFISSILAYIFPYRCVNCRTILTADNSICVDCFKQFDFICKPYCQKCGTGFAFAIENKLICGQCSITPPSYQLSRSLFKFNQDSRKIIHRFKYNDHLSAAKFFSKLIISQYRLEIEDAELICPVPMHRFKRIFRRYNPPQILGQYLAKSLQIPQIPDLLIKSKWTKSQINLNKKQRQKNLNNSIKFNAKYAIKDKIILLIDDVKTTGTTSQICSKLLLKHGAKSVKLVTIAAT